MKTAYGHQVALALVSGLLLLGACKEDGEGPAPECPDDLVSLQILSPVAGDTLHAGVATEIKWCYAATVSNVQIDFTNDGEETWHGITTTGGVIKPTNTFSWTPDAAWAGASCVIRVAQYGETDINVMSGTFVLVP